MLVFCRNPIDWYRSTCFDVLCLPMDAYCVDGVGVRRLVFEVEVVNLVLQILLTLEINLLCQNSRY
jgi:hypothetical protein